jgi:coenzyme F420-0:L-glutamate ligase/coenzyme F420-1:gamma-L-glutamate ligase
VEPRLISLIPIEGMPLISAGDDLCELMIGAMNAAGHKLQHGDVLVVTQKIVSKAAGLVVDLAEITPSSRAFEIAETHGGDPRHIEVVLQQSRQIVIVRPNLLIAEHLCGAIMANAGVDRSNVDAADGRDLVIILPPDPDAAAQSLRDTLHAREGVDIAVILSDSWGRPWRLGTTGAALGVAGLAPLRDLRGTADLFGAPLRHSLQAVGDELAAAANLVMGQAAEGVPVVLVRGFVYPSAQGAARDLLRPRDEDVFR